MNITVRSYKSAADAAAFRALNETWILQYFSLESKDREVLENPEDHILAPGGCIFVMEDGVQIIGCVALIPMGPGRFELSKMAIAPEMQGRGLGRTLLKFAIGKAREMGADELILGTNSRLHAAVHLYREAGFEILAPEHLAHLEYKRADMVMALNLHALNPLKSERND